MLQLMTIDNRLIARSPWPHRDQWGWILFTIADEFRCWHDDVGEEEDGDGRLFVTVRGERVAYTVLN